MQKPTFFNKREIKRKTKTNLRKQYEDFKEKDNNILRVQKSYEIEKIKSE